jgi:hypothetical protein
VKNVREIASASSNPRFRILICGSRYPYAHSFQLRDYLALDIASAFPARLKGYLGYHFSLEATTARSALAALGSEIIANAAISLLGSGGKGIKASTSHTGLVMAATKLDLLDILSEEAAKHLVAQNAYVTLTQKDHRFKRVDAIVHCSDENVPAAYECLLREEGSSIYPVRFGPPHTWAITARQADAVIASGLECAIAYLPEPRPEHIDLVKPEQ